MNLDQKYYQKLELNTLLEMLSNDASLDYNKTRLANLAPISSFDATKEVLANTDEALRILYQYGGINFYFHQDLEELIEKSAKGAILLPLDLILCSKLYLSVKDAMSHPALKGDFPYFKSLVSHLSYNGNLYEKIVNAISIDGEILDSASPALRKIRKRLQGIDADIRKALKDFIDKHQDLLQDSQMVLRDDELCVSVKSTYKTKVPGLIRDISSTSQTIYVTPSSVMHFTNEKNLLKREEKQEIEKILKELSDEVRIYIDEINTDYQVLLKLDFNFAKASFARSLNASLPNLVKEPNLFIKNGRHPLIDSAKVVANTILLDTSKIGMLISGPNTGGKTVLIKMIGLFCLMAKCGLLIPADEGSIIPFFDQILCDIGDDQSIENNLSTFSAHLLQIKEIVNLSTANSLVIFDELGSGTDPEEGGALAIAVMKYLIDKKTKFITTSHYEKVKSFAFEKDEILSCSMGFDFKTFKPDYLLKVGQTGSSNALYIAKNLGLNEDILNDAASIVASSASESAILLKKLELSLSEVEEKNKKLEKDAAKLNAEIEKYSLLSKSIEDHRLNLEKKAKLEADRIIEEAKKEASELIDKILSKKDENLKLHEVIQLKEEVKKIGEDIESPLIIEDKVDFKVGDYVYLLEYSQYGHIKAFDKKNKAIVRVGNMEFIVPTSKIRGAYEKKTQNTPTSDVLSPKHLSINLDLRGKRVDEAKEALDKYFDDMHLAGLKSAIIIHGFGTGAVREMVQEYLRNEKSVEEYRYGNEAEGGRGVTVVTLKGKK